MGSNPTRAIMNKEDIIDRLFKTPKFFTKDTFGNTVSMPNEITEQNAAERREAATEIYKLRKMLSEITAERDEAFKKIDELEDVCGDSADRMVTLRKERDEARRMYCELFAVMHGRTPSYVANSLDWDYYQKEIE